MDVKPWEPVRYGRWSFETWDFALTDACKLLGSRYPLNITLANGQKIIVRALSEERKAARAERKRYHSIVASPLYTKGQEALNSVQSRILARQETNR